MIAFETDPTNVEGVKSALKRNGLDGVEVVPVALGAETGTALLEPCRDRLYLM